MGDEQMDAARAYVAEVLAEGPVPMAELDATLERAGISRSVQRDVKAALVDRRRDGSSWMAVAKAPASKDEQLLAALPCSPQELSAVGARVGITGHALAEAKNRLGVVTARPPDGSWFVCSLGERTDLAEVGVGVCPEREEGYGHVWESAADSDERPCIFCGRSARGPGGYLEEQTAARGELFSILRTPKSIKGGKG